MRIPSGVTDQGFYFVAVDATDYVSRETGLSSFTVVRSRNGAADAAMTTPTVTEIDATTMPGVYFLLCDEDMTLASGNQSEAMAYHITHAGMAPVTQQIEIYRPSVTAGETLTVASGIASAAVQSIANGAITAASIASSAFEAAKFASGAFDAVWSVAARLLTAGTNIVLAKGTGVTGFNDLSAAQVNAEADTALADYDPPTNTEMVAAFTEIKGATWSSITDTLEALRDRGDAAWITATGFSTLDAAGVRTAVGLASANLDTQLGDIPTNAELATSQAAADDATLAAIATAQADLDLLTGADGAVLATSQPNYAPATAAALATTDGKVDDIPTNAELAVALGTADDAVLAAIVTVDTVVDAIKAKTDSLAFTGGNVHANVEAVNAQTVTGSGTAADPWGP